MEETDVGGLAYKLPELYIPRGSIYCCVFISILGYMETRGSSPSRMAVYKIQLVDGSPGRFHVDRQKQWKFTSTSIYVLYLLIRATVYPFGGVRGSFQLLPRKLLRSIYFHAKGSKARTVMGVVDRGRGLMTSTRTYRFHIVCSQTAGGLLL